MSILAVAPMDGITNNAFRQITSKLRNQYWDKQNHELYMWTEFMSVEWYTRHPQRLCHHILKNTSQLNVIAQIYWWDGESLLQTAIDIDQKYSLRTELRSSDLSSWWKWWFVGIELNIWCPSPKIYACESWVGMLRNRPRTLEIIKSISSSIKLPFSIKTRAWLNQEDKKAQFEWILSVAKYCDMITIHGRTYKDGHSGPVDYQYIYDIKTALIDKPNIYGRDTKILANWWLSDYQDWIDKIGNLDGVMRWQASMKNPFLVVNHKPDLRELRNIILEHLDMYIADDIYMSMADSFDHSTKTLIQMDDSKYSQIISDLKNKQLQKYTYIFDQDPEDIAKVRRLEDPNSGNRHSVIEYRKHLFRYITWLEWNKEFKQKVTTIRNYYELVNEINVFFDSFRLE